MSTLVLCWRCNRHARAPACPFCGAAVGVPTAASRTRASRAALLAIAAAAPFAACAEPHVVMYGAPPEPQTSASATPVVPASETTHVSAYGGPPTASPEPPSPK